MVTIYKADAFSVSDEIIYIPDIWLNNLDTLNGEDDGISYAQRVTDNCYTGKDFVDECGGDKELAERLFYYCDWQHPSSALPEVDDREERMEHPQQHKPSIKEQLEANAAQTEKSAAQRHQNSKDRSL